MRIACSDFSSKYIFTMNGDQGRILIKKIKNLSSIIFRSTSTNINDLFNIYVCYLFYIV